MDQCPKQLKANPATQKLPILMLSNLTEESVVTEALKIGAIGYVVKSQVTPHQVVAKVTNLLHKLLYGFNPL